MRWKFTMTQKKECKAAGTAAVTVSKGRLQWRRRRRRRNGAER